MHTNHVIKLAKAVCKVVAMQKDRACEAAAALGAPNAWPPAKVYSMSVRRDATTNK
jgi:hypothetical protein